MTNSAEITAQADAYAKVVLMNSNNGNIKASEEALLTGIRQLYESGSDAALASFIVGLALDAVNAKKPGGDVLSLSLLEHVRSLAGQGSMPERARLFGQIAQGLEGKINNLPAGDFAGDSAKLIWASSLCVLAMARGDLQGAREFAQMIDENMKGELGYGTLVEQWNAAVTARQTEDDRFVNLFRNPADALKNYGDEARDAFAKGDMERFYRLSEAYLKLYPKATGAAANKGLALLKMKKYAEAVSAFDYAISLMPDDPFVWQTWLQRAEAAWVLGRNDQIVQSLMAIHRLNPQEARGLLSDKHPQGRAFHDFLRTCTKEGAEYQRDAHDLLATYYSTAN